MSMRIKTLDPDTRGARRRVVASGLCGALLNLVIAGCASTREYRLADPGPAPAGRVVSATLTTGEVINFDEPGAIWIGTEELSGRVGGEIAMVPGERIEQVRIRSPSSRPLGSGPWGWVVTGTLLAGVVALFVFGEPSAPFSFGGS